MIKFFTSRERAPLPRATRARLWFVCVLHHLASRTETPQPPHAQVPLREDEFLASLGLGGLSTGFNGLHESEGSGVYGGDGGGGRGGRNRGGGGGGGGGGSGGDGRGRSVNASPVDPFARLLYPGSGGGGGSGGLSVQLQTRLSG